MSNISAADVNNLRRSTGAGMMDCKKALVESGGDFDKAVEVLRKKGQKIAAGRADRASSEGVVVTSVSPDNSKGVIISLNCETDFVAKNDDFVNLAKELAKVALSCHDKEEFEKTSFGGISVKEKLIEQTGIIGEKVEIGNFERLEAPFIGSYIHAGNKIASLVGISINFDRAEEVSKNIAMQVAAMNPISLDENSVDEESIDKEREIAKEQLLREGKSEEILDKILPGKLKRFFKDNTLIHQDYIKGDKQSVSDYLKSIDPDLKILSFKRASINN